MLIKKIHAKRRRAAPTAAYLLDEPVFGLRFDAEPGPKVIEFAFRNFAAEKRSDAIRELESDAAAYCGKGEPFAHWAYSHRPGVFPRAGETVEFWERFLADQGMTGHKIVIADHWNGERYDSHALVLRVAPEPDADGRYKIPRTGACRTWKNEGRQNDEILSARHTVEAFCQEHGYQSGLGEMGKDKIRLGQRLAAAEAHAGQPHPTRLAAQEAVKIFRASTSQAEAETSLAAAGLSFKIVERSGRPAGGVLAMPAGEKIYLSSLPKDCRLSSLQAKWTAEAFTPPKPTEPTAAPPDFYKEYANLNAVKVQARRAISAAKTMAEAVSRLAQKGLRLERYGKTGCYLYYGQNEDQRIKLSALGGKYSLLALAKRFAQASTPAHALTPKPKASPVSKPQHQPAPVSHATPVAPKPQGQFQNHLQAAKM